MTAVFDCRALTAGYGNLAVARDFNIDLAAGRVLSVLGPNGAGKTTLLATMAGLLPRIGGEVVVDGHVVAERAPERGEPGGRRARTRRSRAVHEAHGGGEPPRRGAEAFGSSTTMSSTCSPRCGGAGSSHAGALSGGEQQMLAMARALVQRPRVLLIDEMSMGLAPVIVEELLPVVRRVADDTGAVVVLVEQHVHLALEIADDAIVLVHGEVLLAGDAREIAGDAKQLETAYLGAATS